MTWDHLIEEIFQNQFLGPLKSVIVYNRRKIYLDNVVFRMHYIWYGNNDESYR